MIKAVNKFLSFKRGLEFEWKIKFVHNKQFFKVTTVVTVRGNDKQKFKHNVLIKLGRPFYKAKVKRDVEVAKIKMIRMTLATVKKLI